MRRGARFVAPWLVAMTLGVGACGTSEIPVLLVTGGGMDAGVDAHIGVDAGTDATFPAPDGSPPAMTQDFCSQTGPPVLEVTTDAGTVPPICPDQLAQRAFRYALCTCGGYVSDHALVTDAFDGSQGGYDQARATAGGSVGVNGDFHPYGTMTIGGSVWATDNEATFTTVAMTIAGDLHVAHAELQPTMLAVHGDAWLGGGIQTSGSVTINGTMHVPATAPTSVTGMLTYGATDAMSFPYSPACDCDSPPFVDVAGVVRTYETQNDDAARGLDKTTLANVQSPDGGEFRLTMTCGRYFFTSIGGTAPIHLTANGHVAIFVKGDLSTANFRIDVPTGSELDLFVGGSITVNGDFLVGDASNPARARTYVGGSAVNLQMAATLAGNLYAPGAMVTLGSAAPTILFGSLFALGVVSNSDLTIHYDQAILTPSLMPTCTVPTSCSSACDCNGQACNSGTCGPCSESQDCCTPLVCSQGQCIAAVSPR